MPGDNADSGASATDCCPEDARVQHTRAWTGLWVVLGGDVAIAVAACIAVVLISRHSSTVTGTGTTSATSGVDTTSMVAILTSAFTAIGTLTTAYFGIRAASNTAQSSLSSGGATAATTAAKTANDAADKAKEATAKIAAHLEAQGGGGGAEPKAPA